MNRLNYLVIAAAMFFATGCISYSTLHTATPVETGETELGASVGFWGATASIAAYQGENAPEASGGAGVPINEYDVRFGAAENLDIGLKTNFMGLGLDFNYAIVNSPSFAFSVNPGVFQNGFGILWGAGYLNVLADVLKTDTATFSLGLKPGYWYSLGGADGFGAFVGGTTTLRLDLTDKLALTPGVDVIYPLENNTANVTLITAQIGGKFKL